MSTGSYNYDPTKLTENGKDKMRFELGDTMVEGGNETAALTDEEINAALESHPGKWKRSKLMLLESLCRRFAFEVDTRTGPLTLNLQERAKLWRKDYDELKKEVAAESAVVPDSLQKGGKRPPYFYAGMQENERAHYSGGKHRW